MIGCRAGAISAGSGATMRRMGDLSAYSGSPTTTQVGLSKKTKQASMARKPRRACDSLPFALLYAQGSRLMVREQVGGDVRFTPQKRTLPSDGSMSALCRFCCKRQLKAFWVSGSVAEAIRDGS
jgi:hypothetical protein